jgi:rhodanese-related sulfurtransferase
MPIDQIDPPGAKQRLEANDGSVYLDVRSVTEFEAGHVPGALNVPIMHLDPATRQMTPNAEFLAVVRAVLPPDTELVVGCQSGKRSQMACEQLAAAGYSSLSNMTGGFGGARDPMGRVLAPGWLQSGFPQTADAGDGSYAALKGKSGL